MSHKRFENAMNELQGKYHRIPPVSSSQKIFNAVQESKRKKMFSGSFSGIVAASIAAVLIGTILMGSFLGGEHMGRDSDNSALIGTGDGLETGTFGVEENGDDSTSAGITALEDFKERPITFSETLSLEGMNEEVTLDLHVNEVLGFSTYIDSEAEMAMEIYNREDEHIGNQYKITDLFTITIISFDKDVYSIDELETRLQDDLTSEGYKESQEAYPVFQQAVRQGDWIDENFSHKYYALIEREGRIFTIESELPIEAMEGRFPYVLQIFVDELQFR